MEDEYPGNTLPQTVPSMIRNAVQRNPYRIAVAYKQDPETQMTGLFIGVNPCKQGLFYQIYFYIANKSFRIRVVHG